MIRAIAIDDEPQALEILKHYASKVEEVQLMETFTSSVNGLSYLKEHDVDLLFLDIKMPDLTGMELLSLLPKPVPTVLTTAYDQYALQSYDYLCIDYLLKPISFARFLAAIEKYAHLSPGIAQAAHEAAVKPERLVFDMGQEKILLDADEIAFIEADGNYCHIQCRDRRLLLPNALKRIEEKLPSCFRRIHRSFIVNTKLLTSVESYQLHVGKHRLPIGRKYRKAFREYMEGLQ